MEYSHLIKYIHGDQTPKWILVTMHVLGIGFGVFYLWQITPYNYFDFIQQVIFVFLSWDLIGGIVSTANPYGKRFWKSKPIIEKELYLLIHLSQPIALYLFFGAELVSCFFVLIAGVVSSYFLIKTRTLVNRVFVPILLAFSLFTVLVLGGFSEYVVILPFAYLVKLALFTIKTS